MTCEWIRWETTIFGSEVTSTDTRTRNPPPPASFLYRSHLSLTCTSFMTKALIPTVPLHTFPFLPSSYISVLVSSSGAALTSDPTTFHLSDVTFFIGPCRFPAASTTYDKLHCTTFILLMLKEQKNYTKGEGMGHRSSGNTIACPVHVTTILTL